MTESGSTATIFGGVALLERAITYTLGSLQLVTCEAMSRPTPCAEWDLRTLLAHMNDSLLALQEAVDLGHVRLAPLADDQDPTVDPVAALRSRAGRLLGAWTGAEGSDPVSVGGCPVTTSVVTCTGAVEIAVHGWDVAHGCGRQRPLPPSLVEELLACSAMVVTDTDRPARFAEAVHVSPWASAGDRLLAFLGRDIRWGTAPHR